MDAWEGLAQRHAIHGAPGAAGIEIVARSLVPLDLARFPPASAAVPPLVDIAAARARREPRARICLRRIMRGGGAAMSR